MERSGGGSEDPTWTVKTEKEEKGKKVWEKLKASKNKIV